MSGQTETWEYHLWALGISLAILSLGIPGVPPALHWVAVLGIVYMTRVFQVDGRRSRRRSRR